VNSPVAVEDASRCPASAAISLHIYRIDVSRIGSSVRRYYDQPVLAPR
jgi:hypothetical protein